MEAAHNAAFENLCTSVISGGNVERMSMPRERYLASILQKLINDQPKKELSHPPVLGQPQLNNN